MKEKLFAYVKGMKKEQVAVYALLAVLLIVIALPVRKKTEEGQAQGQVQSAQEEETQGTDGQAWTIQEEGQAERMERQLEEALSKVEGVGQVEVVLTLESTGQKIVEKDTPSSRSVSTQGEGGDSTSSSQSASEESTVYERDADGRETPYVVSESYPQVRGVLVIAQGGDDPVVVQQISEGVMALFRVEAHKIKVMKMK